MDVTKMGFDRQFASLTKHLDMACDNYTHSERIDFVQSSIWNHKVMMNVLKVYPTENLCFVNQIYECCRLEKVAMYTYSLFFRGGQQL